MSESARPSNRACVFWACLGAIILGVTLPVLLVLLHGLTHATPQSNPEQEAFVLFVLATIFCSPGALVISLVVWALCLEKALSASAPKSLISYGAIVGCCAGFFNLPGYMSMELLRDDKLGEVLLLALFVVAGSSAGAWIGWQAWRARHPGQHFFPQFSLRTLMLLVFFWGALLLLFTRPRQLDQKPTLQQER